jgi:heme-degrading monooxygenase HmoA
MMFIAMNRFRVKKGSEEAFEQVWLSRDTQLTKVPGFVEFHLLKGPEHEDYTLYSSHTVWQSKATFEAWTKSEAFRLAHRDAGQNKPLYLDHPQFEGFEVRQTVRRGKDAVAWSGCRSGVLEWFDRRVHFVLSSQAHIQRLLFSTLKICLTSASEI